MSFKSASTINDVVNHIYKDTFFSGFSHSMYRGNKFLGEEIFQEFLLAVCEKPEQKILDLYNRGQFNYYSVRMIKNIAYYKSGKICKYLVNYEKNKVLPEPFQNKLPIENPPRYDDEKGDKLLSELDQFFIDKKENDDWYWYDEKLFKMYFMEKQTYRKISELTGIPHTSVFLSIKQVVTEIQAKFGRQYNHLFINLNQIL